MTKIIRHIILFTLLLLTSCDKTVLEYPENGGYDPTLVHTNLTFTVDPAIEPYTSTKVDPNTEEHDVRWIIELFRNEIEGEPIERRILTCDPATDLNHTISASFTLHAAQYHVVAWADYVNDGSTDDKYYQIDDLSSIRILEDEDYLGDEEHKDTYIVNEELDLSGYRNSWNETVEGTLTLERPMAKIEFITTDIEKMLNQLKTKRSKSGRAVSENLLADNPDLSSIQVTVSYAGFLPSGFNAYTNKPNDARTGVSFDCSMTPLSDKEACLGSDYIFVNGSESAVTVNLSIRDDKGNVLNEVSGINVPIVRGKLTTIRDEFLTKSYTPGIGIDTDFEGEINIVIPD